MNESTKGNNSLNNGSNVLSQNRKILDREAKKPYRKVKIKTKDSNAKMLIIKSVRLLLIV